MTQSRVAFLQRHLPYHQHRRRRRPLRDQRNRLEAMAQTRAVTRSQQPPPLGGQRRPRSARRVPGAPHAALDQDVIELSDDEEANQPRRKKARMDGRDTQGDVVLVEIVPPRNGGPSGVQRQEGAQDDANVNAPRLVKIDMPRNKDAQLEEVKAVDDTIDLQDIIEVADPMDHYLSLVLEVVPDMDPEHAMALIQRNLPDLGEGVVQHIIHHALENPTYPRLDKKGKKRKRDDSPSSSSVPAPACNFASIKREFTGGGSYSTIALVCAPRVAF